MPESFSPTDFATLLAGVIGAALGGLISWGLAYQTSRETLMRDNIARDEAQKAIALGVLLKIQQIANGYYTQKLYIWEALSEANEKGAFHLALSQKVKPQIGNSHPTPSFVAEEFIPLVTLKRTDLIDQCSMIAMRYDILNTSFKVYNEKRHNLQEILMSFPTKVEGDGRSTSDIPKESVARVRILSEEVEQLIQQIYIHITEDGAASLKLCVALNEVFSNGFKEFIKLEVPEQLDEGA